MKQKLRALGRFLVGYMLATVVLFAVYTAMFGLKPTLWGFAIFYFVCTLGVLAVCWQEERQWSRRAACSKDPGARMSAHVVSPVADPVRAAARV